MNPDLRPLRDIHDTLGNPWWPLAPGWWLLIAVVVGVVALIWHFRRAPLLLPSIPLLHIGDWRSDARRELRRLRRAPHPTSVKKRLAELSELLKRIAMARHGRASCAGLHGQAWLDWLSTQDPDGFDWRQQGQLLVRAPYAPDRVQLTGRAAPGSAAEARSERDTERELQQLIAATERWITAPLNAPKRRAEASERQSRTPTDSKLGILFGKLATAFGRRRPPPETA